MKVEQVDPMASARIYQFGLGRIASMDPHCVCSSPYSRDPSLSLSFNRTPAPRLDDCYCCIVLLGLRTIHEQAGG